VYRLNNRSHNTLVVNDRLQRVEGKAEIVAASDTGDRPHTVIDMSDVYKGQLAEARRGVALLKGQGVVVQDELQAGREQADVRWAMVTRAEVALNGSEATLRQDGKTLKVSVLEPAGATLQLLPAKGTQTYDAPNPNARMIAFSTAVDPHKPARLVVWLRPAETAEGDSPSPPTVIPLAKW